MSNHTHGLWCACLLGALGACGGDDDSATTTGAQVQCGEGTHLAAGACVADVLDPPLCGAGTQLENGLCIPAAATSCGQGTKLVGSECLPESILECGTGTQLENGVCVPAETTTCGGGTKLENGVCVPESTLECGAGTHEVAAVCVPDDETQVTKAVVGKLLYFDTNLSTPPGQSCGSCHSPDTGFADPDRDLPVSRGVNPWLFGNRNSPTSAYMVFSPEFHFDSEEGLYEGGQFWDGRAKDLVEQAKGPFLNPLEMNNADEAEVVGKVAASEYAALFEKVYGAGSLDNVESAYGQIAEAIAEWEGSAEVNRFASKFDHVQGGTATYTAQEQRGLDLFNDPDKGNCAACHESTGEGDVPPLFTDFTYDNLGVPRNPNNPFLTLPSEHNPDGADFIDLGLGGSLEEPEQNGKFKVPTLRNIALTAPYMHNGVFNTLKEVVDFYNARDLGGFPPPEVAENMNTDELGNLGLTDDEVADIVAFMGTLTDGYVPVP